MNKKIFKILTFCLLCSFMLQNIPVLAKDWGVSFQKENEVPVGNETAEYLREFDAYFVDDTDEKVLYLTFDAGYENGYTENILNVLKENNVPATFFLVGNYFKENAELVKRMEAEGHIVGNHTMKHPDMSSITDSDKFQEQLTGVKELYKEVTGKEMKDYYRPPEGKYNEESLKMSKKLGYKTFFWSIAYNDYDNNKQPEHSAAIKKLISRAHPGAIILLHNTSKTNSEILDQLIKEYRALGYEFKSIDNIS